MYTYKCYFHPKDDSVQSCKGCKLPVCAGCTGAEGFCPECTKKRESVQKLKQLRTVMSAQRASSTTGRLRLARQAMRGSRELLALPPAPPVPAGPPISAYSQPPRAKTRPFADTPDRWSGKATPPARQSHPPKPQAAKPQAPKTPAKKPAGPGARRYNPDAVAYKSANTRKPTPAAPVAKHSSWMTPFAVGLGVGVVIVGIFMFMHGHGHAANASVPDEASFSAQEQHMLADLRREGSGKREAPEVHLSFPASGQTLSGVQFVKADIDAPQKLTSLVLVIDGQTVGSTTAVDADSEIQFDAASFAPGPHRLKLVGYNWEHVAAETPDVRFQVSR